MTNLQSPFRDSPYFRLDPRHEFLDLVERAVKRISSADVKLQLSNDVLQLTGFVKTWHEKQMIQESIRDMVGKRTIKNDLRVA